MDAFAAGQCPGTCGKLLSAGAVPGCWNSRESSREELGFQHLCDVILSALV